MQSNNIHLVKAAFHTQFKTAMECLGFPADLYFKKVNLPIEISNPEGLLPLKPFYQLINTVAINENFSGFGAYVAQLTPWHKVASLGPLIKSSNNLKELLLTFCKVASGQSSPVVFSLADEGSHSSFTYANTLIYKREIQMELYRISSMIQLIQLAASAGWRPDSIRLIMPENEAVNACPLFLESEILFSQGESAITFPNNFLKLPVHIDIPENIDLDRNALADTNIKFSKSIQQIIDTYVIAENNHIEDIASAADLSVRTLQRRLAQCDLSFKELMNQAKFSHAKEKLQDENLSITKIAKSMNYSDAAHFSRAFHQWSGVSPTDYKKTLAESRK